MSAAADARTATREPPWLLELEERPYDADFHLAFFIIAALTVYRGGKTIETREAVTA